MNGMFYNAVNFNSDLSKWEVDKVTSMNSNHPAYKLQRMFNGATSFDRTLCHTKWKTLDAFVDGYGRSGCCDSGSYMTNQHLNPFNATDGEGSCQQCPSGWMSMSAYPNANSNCTICGPGTSSISKSTNCKACARGRKLTRINPLLWYVIHVAFLLSFIPPSPVAQLTNLFPVLIFNVPQYCLSSRHIHSNRTTSFRPHADVQKLSNWSVHC
jgi:surface protein